MENNVITISNVSKVIDQKVCNTDINLFVKKGESVGLLGPNGAGKTTLIRQIMGLISVSSGNVNVNGFDPFKSPTKALKDVGYIAGEILLPEKIKPLKYFKIVAGLKGVTELSNINKMISFFNLDITKPIGKLSKGNKQKVAIIAAFIGSPSIMVLDEPSTGLDPLMQKKLSEIISKLKHEGTSFLIATHIFEELENHCDRVVFLKNGEVKDVDVKNKDKIEVENYNRNKIFLENRVVEKAEKLKTNDEKPEKVNEKPKAIDEKTVKVSDAIQIINYEVVFINEISEKSFPYNNCRQVDKHTLAFDVSNDDIKTFLLKIADYKIKDINIKEKSLRQEFMEFYE